MHELINSFHRSLPEDTPDTESVRIHTHLFPGQTH
jgi:hypothetical protein